jgi:tellurite resistance protein TehA-like permease
MLGKAKTQSDVNLGQYIIIGGLGIQIFFFQIFIITTGIFHYRILRFPSQHSQSLTVPWQRFLMVLYASSALILVRSVFRIAQYVMGQDGILLSHEYYLYIFDGCLMFLCMVLFIIWHPSKIIRKTSNEPVVEMLGYEIDDEAKRERRQAGGR